MYSRLVARARLLLYGAAEIGQVMKNPDPKFWTKEKEQEEWEVLNAITENPLRLTKLAAHLSAGLNKTIKPNSVQTWFRYRDHYWWLSVAYPGRRGHKRAYYIVTVEPLVKVPVDISTDITTQVSTDITTQVSTDIGAQVIIQDFMKNLRQEITRRRKENHDERHRMNWNPEAITKRFQTDLIEYIEDQLDIVSSDVINVIVAAQQIKLRRAAKRSHIGKKRKKHHVQKNKSNGSAVNTRTGERVC